MSTNRHTLYSKHNSEQISIKGHKIMLHVLSCIHKF